MLNIVKELKANTLFIRLVGSVDENSNFEQLIGAVPGELVVNCKEVPRINSIGVKAWMKYFGFLQEKGVKLRFSDVSPAIMEQFNLISNFHSGGAIDSVYVPFNCQNCKSELVGLFKTEDLKKIQFDVPSVKCSKCGGEAQFDDIPDEYFRFLMKLK